jgi:hypothetical protein
MRTTNLPMNVQNLPANHSTDQSKIFFLPGPPTKKVDCAKAVPFIRTNKDTWGLAQDIDPSVPGCVPSLKNDSVPVISCIGTSRDGKSTFLNLYCNWLLQRRDVTSKPFAPFIARQSDEAVTNGIDFYHLEGHCLLLDCQGMQLEDAKYDHHLALITYLISDVIILTVRQRLDLQILNNLLSVFSFLPEIPEESRRKDKPQLVIRIKDFQNAPALKADNLYLEKLIKKWLTPSNDQYDQIKKAFDQTFTINPIATLPPRYDEKNEEDQFLDIHSRTFPAKNPSFINACQKVFELSKNFKTSDLLTKDGLPQLIQKMKENKKIDYKKLDLYHNIASNEINEYGLELLTQHKWLQDDTLVEKMDGSRKAYILWKERNDLIDEIDNNTFNIKFKDVTQDIKNKLRPKFTDFRKIVENAKTKNYALAEQLIKSHWTVFNNKFEETILSKMINGFVDIFIDKQTEFKKRLDEIDFDIAQRYDVLLNTEKRDLENKRELIAKKNKSHKLMLNDLITKYDINKTSVSILRRIVQDMNVTNLKYNLTIEQIGNEIINEIRRGIDAIYKDNNIVWCLDKNNCVITLPQMEYNTEETINKNTTLINNGSTTHAFEMICINQISDRLNKIGFLRAIEYQSLSYIAFVELKCCDCIYLMTKEFYEEQFYSVIKHFIQTNEFIKIICQPQISQPSLLQYFFEFTHLDPLIQQEKKNRIESTITNQFLCDVLAFCVENKLKLV